MNMKEIVVNNILLYVYLNSYLVHRYTACYSSLYSSSSLPTPPPPPKKTDYIENSLFKIPIGLVKKKLYFEGLDTQDQRLFSSFRFQSVDSNSQEFWNRLTLDRYQMVQVFNYTLLLHGHQIKRGHSFNTRIL